MNSVLMGLNRFINCRTIIAWHEHPLLKAEAGLPSLQLDTTKVGERVRSVRIEGQNVAVGKEDFRLITSEAGTVLFGGDQAILIATQIDEHTLHIKLDLRPLGLNIFDDVAGLHIGGNTWAHNSVTGSEVVIRLA
jgi:hypothetical protein